MKTVLTLVARLGVVLALLGCASVAAPAGFVRADTVPANPVLVIGGFDADRGILEKLRSELSDRGYTAYSMVLPGIPAGSSGSAGIAESATAVAREVAEIRQAAGARRVDLVGHSMGGLAQRHYVKFLGGLNSVGTYVDFGTPNFGQPLGYLCALVFPGCRDIAPGSEFLQQLNAPPALPPGLPAYHLYSEDEGPERDHLPGAVNASVQQFCPGRHVIHRNEPQDGAFQDLIDSALHGGPLVTDCPRQFFLSSERSRPAPVGDQAKRARFSA
ncbi:esterase/lipase family protein [Nocardia sienata]|uniref:esterase/lipase family protein n=1 Tax=Nocardia sienata TaxID=248552 RepID=UPI000AA85FDB|nr:alpha/beta fold hydrolase [Nocardia sienata]